MTYILSKFFPRYTTHLCIVLSGLLSIAAVELMIPERSGGYVEMISGLELSSVIQEEWHGLYEPGNVDSVVIFDDVSVISGWVGPETRQILIESSFQDEFKIDLFARPDISAHLLTPDRDLYGVRFEFPSDAVECIWFAGQNVASLRWSSSSDHCG